MLPSTRLILTACAITAAASSITALAGEATAAKPSIPVEKEKTIFDRIWEYPTIYKNKDSDFLNEVRLVGRFHLDQYNLDSALGHDSDWVVRRLRVGIKAQLFKNLTAHVETDLSPQDPDPLYSRLTDAYLSWKFSDALRLTAGKHAAKFTLDGGTSSNELITIDRSNLANNFWFPNEYAPGISLSGTKNEWSYSLGFYSGGSESPEFGNFDAGNFWVASLGYDFAKILGVKRALLRLDYVHNDRNSESGFTRSLENVGSVVFMLDNKRWGVSTDLSWANGYGSQGDLFGFQVMPWFNLTDKLQVVARYTYLNGDQPNSVRFSRYESALTGRRGDEYSEIYAGLNYFIHGHKLKLQTGFAYATMGDRANDGGEYSGWSWTTALRVSW